MDGPAREHARRSVLSLSLLLSRTDDVAVAVHGGLAFPNGFSFTLALRLRTVDEKRMRGPLHHWHVHRELDDDVLRFGIRFADGSKATIFDMPRHVGADDPPAGPVLMQRGGGGGGRSWDNAFWVWPLPPPGSFAFVCEWPAYGIGVTEVEIDTAAIHDAASRAETLWPDADVPRGAGGTIWVQGTG